MNFGWKRVSVGSLIIITVGGGCAVWKKEENGSSVLSAQFYCEPKIALKLKLINNKKVLLSYYKNNILAILKS